MRRGLTKSKAQLTDTLFQNAHFNNYIFKTQITYHKPLRSNMSSVSSLASSCPYLGLEISNSMWWLNGGAGISFQPAVSHFSVSLDLYSTFYSGFRQIRKSPVSMWHGAPSLKSSLNSGEMWFADCKLSTPMSKSPLNLDLVFNVLRSGSARRWN